MLEVAPDLLGCVVSFNGCSGIIVETEAYHHTEAACHAYVGITPRTAVLYGPPGTAYVYRSYGIHALLNAVCEPEGVGAAVGASCPQLRLKAASNKASAGPQILMRTLRPMLHPPASGSEGQALLPRSKCGVYDERPTLRAHNLSLLVRSGAARQLLLQ